MESPYLTPHTPRWGEERCHLPRAVRELLGGDGCREARNPGRFLGWRRWGGSSPGCPRVWALKAIRVWRCSGIGSIGKAPGVARRRGSGWSLGRQLEKVPRSSREELICRVGENRKRRLGGFSVIPPSKDSTENSGNHRDDSLTFQDTL